jgi:hypothetical protein
VNSVCEERALKGPNAGADHEYCNPMSILADICVLDHMGGMHGCKKAYNSMCNSSISVVRGCKEHSGIRTILTSKMVVANVQSICSDHPMEDCARCPNISSGGKGCNALHVYSSLCKEMPDMAQCQDWVGMCADEELSKGWPEFCLSLSQPFQNPPIMKMFFHFGYVDYILFKQWVPRSPLQYWLSVLAVVLLGIFYEYLLTIRAILEYQWAERDAQRMARLNNGLGGSNGALDREGLLLQSGDVDRQRFKNANPYMIVFRGAGPKFDWSQELLRAFLQFIETVISYSLMLIAMTFNVGLFLGVPLGIALGALMFARFRGSLPKRACCA